VDAPWKEERGPGIEATVQRSDSRVSSLERKEKNEKKKKRKEGKETEKRQTQRELN
jgi:hypothetical protein